MTLLDNRHPRIDIASTIGEPLAWLISIIDAAGDAVNLTGATVDVSFYAVDFSLVDPLPATVSSAELASGEITVSMTNAQTLDAPMGQGTWRWALELQESGEAAASVVAGGELKLYHPAIFRSAGVVTVSPQAYLPDRRVVVALA